MKTKPRSPRLLTCALIIILFMAALPAHAVTQRFGMLQETLVEKGQDPQIIAELYSRPEVYFDVSSATGYFFHRESKLNYGQFLEPKPINKAKKYMADNKALLEAAEKKYKVDGGLIVGIMLVETRLGGYTGKKSVFNTLSTLASFQDPENAALLLRAVRKRQADVTMADVQKWIDRKSGWAMRELEAFLVFSQAQGFDPITVTGSYAGAMGYGQFMPTSAMGYAADGDGDGVINLYSHPDAIFSVARYLSSHGWKPGLKKKQQQKVIRTYNNSGPYVKTVLAIREKLNQ